MSPLTRLRRLRLPALVAVAGLVLSACGKEVQPQNVLDPQAPISRQLDNLWNPVFAVAVIVFVARRSARDLRGVPLPPP